MLFSIIVPIFNVEQYLEQCISSLITQDISNYEIILIDDCSTDKSGIIAQEWSKKDSKISYYRKKVNSGLSDTRNYGIKVAKSDYILFIDSDDYIDKNVLGSLKSIIIKNNRPDIVYLGYYLEKQGKYEKKYNYFCDKNVLMNSRQFMKKELQQRNLPIAACFAVYRRQYIIDHTLLFKTGIYHEDELWSPQILYNSNLVYISDMIFYHYVIRQGSITTSKDKTKNGIYWIFVMN